MLQRRDKRVTRRDWRKYAAIVSTGIIAIQTCPRLPSTYLDFLRSGLATWSENSELEREAKIARNRALIEQLDLKNAAASVTPRATPKAKVSATPKPTPKPKAKPVQPIKREKRILDDYTPRRVSARLRRTDPDETLVQKRKREVRSSDHDHGFFLVDQYQWPSISPSFFWHFYSKKRRRIDGRKRRNVSRRKSARGRRRSRGTGSSI